MLHGKDLIVATRAFTGEDRSKSWRYTSSTFFLLLAAYISGLFVSDIVLKFALGILSGLLIVRMFVIYHDFLHKTILQGSATANVLFYLFGLFILAPFSIWRRSHDYHHKHNSKLYTSSIGSFPIVTRNKFLSAPKFEQRLYLFIRHPLTITFGYLFAFIYGMCVLSLIRNPKKHWDSAISLLFHSGIGYIIFWQFGWLTFVLSFLLPALISSAIGSYLFYAQHNFPQAEFRNKDEWSYYEAAMKSSSYMKMNRAMQWFTANIGFHHIHHINARIPFYRLPETFDHFQEFQDPKVTSLNPSEIWACLCLKVWDPAQNRFLTMKEIHS